METNIPLTYCSKCGHEFDHSTSTSEDVIPVEGDVSICIECGHATLYNKDLTLREMTEEEEKEILSNPQIKVLQRLLEG